MTLSEFFDLPEPAEEQLEEQAREKEQRRAEIAAQPKKPTPEYVAANLVGRIRSAQDSEGTVKHIVRYREMKGSALCGRTPGKRSVGWSSQFFDDEQDVSEATCPRCKKLFAEL